MTTTSTLSRERLNALASLFDGLSEAHLVELAWPGELATVRGDFLKGAIGMAMRTEQAEASTTRETDKLMRSCAELDAMEFSRDHWKQRAERAEQVERERDVLRETVDAIASRLGAGVTNECIIEECADMTRAALAEPDAGGDASPYRPMTAVEKEQQRRSFAYGNTHMSNPNVTREMIDEAAERIDAGGDA